MAKKRSSIGQIALIGAFTLSCHGILIYLTQERVQPQQTIGAHKSEVTKRLHRSSRRP